MLTAEDIEIRGTNRSIEPTGDSGCFRPEEVAEMFEHGLLVRNGNYVIDKGLLAEPHEDPFNPWECPVCKLLWPDVLFRAADNACSCGHVLIGGLHNLKETALGEALDFRAIEYTEKKTGLPYWANDDDEDPDPKVEAESDAVTDAYNKGELLPEFRLHLVGRGWKIDEKDGRCWLWAPWADSTIAPMPWTPREYFTKRIKKALEEYERRVA